MESFVEEVPLIKVEERRKRTIQRAGAEFGKGQHITTERENESERRERERSAVLPKKRL